MEAFVFGAYKGGVGRTTALVSIGNAAARCGLNVVIIDMDTDAPSIPTLYGQKVWAVDGAPWRGLVPWIMDSGRTSLESHLDTYYASRGTLRVLAAGPLGPEFLDAQLTATWRDLFEVEGHTFWPYFERSLKRLDPEPDLVLIDARAGLGPVSGSLLTVPDATLVFFFSGDPDSLRVANGLHERASGVARRVVPVLSRVPTFTTGGMRKVSEVISAYIDDPESVLLLPANPGLEGTTEPTIGLTDTGVRPQLAVYHVRLLMELVEDFADPDPQSDPDLALVFDEARKAPKIDFKVFQNVATGHMINPADLSRNVAFKVETIQAVFDRIRDRMEEMGMDQSALDGALVDGGKRAGDAFGHALAVSLHNESAADRLTAWCAFDTEVGFGHLETTAIDNRYRVQITDPFLPHSGGGSKVLEGYVIGVLAQILNPDHVRDAKIEWTTPDAALLSWDGLTPSAEIHWEDGTLVADVLLQERTS